MTATLARYWWVVLLRGILAIIFGLLLIIVPGLAVEAVVLMFGAYALIDGISTVITAIQNRTRERWWVLLVEGIISIIAGVLVFMFPIFASISAVFFVLYIVAFWAVTSGIMQIWSAIQLRKEIDNEFWLGLSGVISVILGILLIIRPGAGILTLLTLIAAFIIVYGVMLIMLAFRLRGLQDKSSTRIPV